VVQGEEPGAVVLGDVFLSGNNESILLLENFIKMIVL
jgi:hypothetical protein